MTEEALLKGCSSLDPGNALEISLQTFMQQARQAFMLVAL